MGNGQSSGYRRLKDDSSKYDENFDWKRELAQDLGFLGRHGGKNTRGSGNSSECTLFEGSLQYDRHCAREKEIDLLLELRSLEMRHRRKNTNGDEKSSEYDSSKDYWHIAREQQLEQKNRMLAHKQYFIQILEELVLLQERNLVRMRQQNLTGLHEYRGGSEQDQQLRLKEEGFASLTEELVRKKQELASLQRDVSILSTRLLDDKHDRLALVSGDYLKVVKKLRDLGAVPAIDVEDLERATVSLSQRLDTKSLESIECDEELQRLRQKTNSVRHITSDLIVWQRFFSAL